jgi:hypothetical protein
MHLTKEKMLSHEELFKSEHFLLTTDFLQKAFDNLSKRKKTIKKEELLEETKRLIIEHIMEQIRENQLNSKKHAYTKQTEKKIIKN